MRPAIVVSCVANMTHGSPSCDRHDARSTRLATAYAAAGDSNRSSERKTRSTTKEYSICYVYSGGNRTKHRWQKQQESVDSRGNDGSGRKRRRWRQREKTHTRVGSGSQGRMQLLR
ncbi:hypothetical protein BHE74_00053425 [Ensete ventricosum]|nr:hypothetical protein BHE74_00053425 [Ensete ventricosum]